MSFFDDLNDLPEKPSKVDNAAEIRKNAHVVNGGEALFPCPSCSGTGMWRGRGRCFKCTGTGKVTKRVLGAAKAKVTRTNNFAAWCEEHRDVIDGLRRHSWNNFLAKLLAQIDGEERALSERQLEIARENIEKWDAKNKERDEQRAAEREKNAKEIGIEAINALFATALDSGLKAPRFRTERLTIKVARLHADTLYVTDGGDYVGKIVSGKFFATSTAKKDVADLLAEIAKDPKGAAIAYGRSTGNCACCGRGLTDPVSVEMGIGPICAGGWGF
ncbi:hypothetical protein EVC17_025 [Rhizobium phage RHph_Y1_1]|nr:hypothetical protein EVB80_025 [Rhizobium phage RHph_I36]QIG75382.1 hypothetical protein EVC17_025 [Rhizobium phage RHph_Y1_1]QIG75932.1 hypothetical protein EVC21_025 [Rhizobium phage RHph_Y2_17_2]